MNKSFQLKLITSIFFLFLIKIRAQEIYPSKNLTEKVQVLNMATFHMGKSSDANTTEYDENSRKNKLENRAIAKSISKFKATVVVVEREPKYEEEVNANYQKYLKNPDTAFENPSEIELLAFEVARLNNVEKIYCIDHQMGYNYGLIDSLAYAIKSNIYTDYMEVDLFPEDPKLSTLELLKLNNQPEYLDYLINVNTDMMTYVSTKGKFEGADEAAKFYQRNLRMFSNFNRIPLKESDRVFLLMGGAHTAFFNMFMSRSQRYTSVSALEYLR